PMTPASPARILLVQGLFFVAGFCGLIYESIWSHYLKLLLGHAAYAQAVVLVVFVGGLALGAWLTGRWSERIRHPVLWYVAIEAAVAIAAFCFHPVFGKVAAWASNWALPTLCAAAGPCWASWAIAAALILPAAILLGATFPLMSAGVIRLGARPGRGLSLLYFLNSAGAALGVLASGFLLIPTLGLPGTLLVAGILNAFVAIAAYAAMRKSGGDAAQPAVAAATPETAAHPRDLQLLLAVAALTGLSSFIYEVVWIRMLTLVLGAATHAFELMLAPFIFGLALGAWWIRDRIERSGDAVLLLARIQILMGVLALATLPLYAASFEAMAWALRALGRSAEGYTLFNLASITLAGAVMLPAAMCAGMTLPLITAVLLNRGHGERRVGQVYGINTFGAIAGVLLTVHVLIPALGLKWSLAFGATVDIVLGVALWWIASGRSTAVPAAWSGASRPLLAGVAALALAWTVIVPLRTPLEPQRMASGVFRFGQPRLDPGHRVVFHRDGKTATITVIEGPGGWRSLITNGKVDGAAHPQARLVTNDDHTMVLLGALGPIHHPEAKSAAVIGLGTGTSSAVLLAAPRIEQVDTIEIEPMMVEAARLFSPRNAAVFEDRRSRIVIDDARAHFSRSPVRYDLVVSEPSNPWVSGVSGLFTQEFYRHVHAHLSDGGHFLQWLHLSEASPEMVASILRAFTAVFPEFRAYQTNGADIVLVARKDGVRPELQVAALDRMPAMQQHLLHIGISSHAVLAAHDAGPADALKALFQSYASPANSDFSPYVDNRAASDRFRRDAAQVLFALRQAPVPLLDFNRGVAGHAGPVAIAQDTMAPQLRAAAAGTQGLRYLKGQALEPLERAQLGALQLDYAVVRGWSANCGFPKETGLPWGPVVRVAANLNPAVAPADASAWWQALDQRCAASLGPAQRAWLQLFAATGARDAQASASAADSVLQLDAQLTD
ncbi:MAG TPA: fused MFS/spermidine synthase, partial [Ramlibacter sp.]|nr:fused MFS/spermidine synthase [Ramlibacter sp.]